MVFVWSYLTDGDPGYTLVQVSVNDLLMLVFFAPIMKFLVAGASNLIVPFGVLFMSVLVFIVIPLAAGVLTRSMLIKAKGTEWFSSRFHSRVSQVRGPERISAALGSSRLPGGQRARLSRRCIARLASDFL